MSHLKWLHATSKNVLIYCWQTNFENKLPCNFLASLCWLHLKSMKIGCIYTLVSAVGFSFKKCSVAARNVHVSDMCHRLSGSWNTRGSVQNNNDNSKKAVRMSKLCHSCRKCKRFIERKWVNESDNEGCNGECFMIQDKMKLFRSAQ